MLDENRTPIRGIAAEERFLYEIMWLRLVIALTTLDELRKIGDIQGTKEKRPARPLSFDPAREAANRSPYSEKAYQPPVPESSFGLPGRWRFCMVATVFSNGHKSTRAPQLPHQQKAKDHRQRVKDMLPNRVVGYSPDLARAVGGATTGLFLSQLLFLSDKGANPDGWVYKSEAEMGKETGLSKREQQTARRKLLSLGVITIMRGGWKNTYHFKVLWEKLYQVIAGIQRPQTVPTQKSEQRQTVPHESVQNVSTTPAQWQQNVSTRWKQNAATHNRENNTENKETEITDRENQTIWDKTVEQVKRDLPLGETAERLAGTALIEVTDTAATIFVTNRVDTPWLERRLYGQIVKAMKAVVGKELDLQFIATS